MNEKKFIVGIFIFTALLLGGMLSLSSKSSKSEETKVNPINFDSGAQAVVEETFYDWGQMQMYDGDVTAEFEIKNSGTGPLQLFNVVTSCACTDALLTMGDISSPIFGMHTRSDYVLEVAPNETAQLLVIFDPAFHGPSGIGPIERQVVVETNDPNSPQITFNLIGDVIK